MSTRGKSGAKALAVIKGQLSATETRLYEICQDFGEVELKGAERVPEDLRKVGHFVVALAMELEEYQEKVAIFTDAFRKTFDLPPVYIRRDHYALRRRVGEYVMENADKYPAIVKEEARKYLQSLRRPD